MKKITPKMLHELTDIQKSRGEMQDFASGFLFNVFRRMDCIDFFRKHYLSSDAKDDSLLSSANGLYIVALVSCWETMIRDAIVFLVGIDSNISNIAKNVAESKGVDSEELERRGITIGEFISKQYNFQNLDDTCRAFNFLFQENKNSIFEFAREVFDRRIYYPTLKAEELKIENLLEAFRKVIDEAFEERHKIVHDASYVFSASEEKLAIMEECLVAFPQILLIGLSVKFNQRYPVWNSIEKYIKFADVLAADESLFIFSASYIRASDWQVVE
ncbi:MAG: hypothetical protein AB9917_11110 [Negativicutes bacterium]